MARWLACALPCRRFADALADANARLGADAVRYTFIVTDLHHLFLAGLPAHRVITGERWAELSFVRLSARPQHPKADPEA